MLFKNIIRIIVLMKKISLHKLVELQPGVYLKKTAKDSRACLLSLGDFDEELNFLGAETYVEEEEVKEKYIIENHHVLFSSRMKFNAFRLPETDGVFVASNSFIILKPDVSKVLPDYLAWYLNHPETQQELRLMEQSTSRMPYISQKKLGDLPIDLPELAEQEDISRIYHLFKKEKEIAQKMMGKKEIYYQTLLMQYLRK